MEYEQSVWNASEVQRDKYEHTQTHSEKEPASHNPLHPGNTYIKICLG
jgi:hypothetical protein